MAHCQSVTCPSLQMSELSVTSVPRSGQLSTLPRGRSSRQLRATKVSCASPTHRLAATVRSRVTEDKVASSRRRRSACASTSASTSADASSNDPPSEEPSSSDTSRRGALFGGSLGLASWMLPAISASASKYEVSGVEAAAVAEAGAVAVSRRYPGWWALPLAPFGNKTTTRSELVQDRVWAFEQLQGILDVLVNIRMTVVALEGGGLWVHNPIAPTEELQALLGELETKHGPVKYVVLGSSAVEHKWCLGRFAKCYPDAQVWATQGQWSWPLNLGLRETGLYPRQLTGLLPQSSADWQAGPGGGIAAPWGDQIQHEVLSVGGTILTGFEDPWFVDCAFFDRRSQTLIVTDAVLSAHSGEPPAVAQVDPRPLLVRAQSGPDDTRQDTPANRREGWGKTLLFGLMFKPQAVDFRLSGNLRKDLRDGYIWDPALYQQSLATIQEPLLFVPPIAEILALPRRAQEFDTWARKVSRWNFTQIVPGHLDAPIKAGPYEFLETFKEALADAPTGRFVPKDLFVINGVEAISVGTGTLQPSRLKYYSTALIDERLDQLRTEYKRDLRQLSA